MACPQHHESRIRGTPSWITLAALIVGVLLITLHPTRAQSQQYAVIHGFSGGADGASPGGLLMDQAGNLYGAAALGGDGSCESGGNFGCGVIYQLKPNGSRWILNPLYSFQGGQDGAYPGSIAFGPDGNLYGTTSKGGGCNQTGCGTIFKLTPPAVVCKSSLCPWTETVLYRFMGQFDGGGPIGPLVFDKSGDMYGAAGQDCAGYSGCIFELTHSGQGWTEGVLYSFTGGGRDGSSPSAGVILDSAGNVYGVTNFGGISDNGTVFELSPSQSGWTENVLYSFRQSNDGQEPRGGLILDQTGNLYGTTTFGGYGGGGTVFLLALTNGGWVESLLYQFSGPGGGGPYASLSMDSTGSLYGTTFDDGGAGSVFKLTPGTGGWTETNLYEFRDSGDGGHPFSNVVVGAAGKLYGTAAVAGLGNCNGVGCGVVWQITQ